MWGCSGDTAASNEDATEPSTTTKVQPVSASTQLASLEDLLAIPDRERNAEQDFQLACHHAKAGRTEDAFATLADAAVKGFGDTDRLKAEPALVSLHEDSRWRQVELFVDVNGAQGALPDQTHNPPAPLQRPQRRQPPSAPVNIPAPQWAMQDIDGNVVKLTDFRGKTVVMDFWATWCGPCKRAMPDIDRFVREHAGPDVVVLSVNVWERSPNVALDWWNDRQFGMRLLFGDRSLTSAYGVKGIPHLCVIDGDGIIRFAQSGYHPRLLNDLIRWTKSEA